MLKKDYRSDYYIGPLIVVLGIIAFFIKTFSTNKILIIISYTVVLTTLFGVPIYRFYMENNIRGALYNLIAMLVLGAFVVFSIYQNH